MWANRYYIILLVLLACTAVSYGQAIFETGYIIDNEGNRTECFIQNLDWGDHPNSFKYKVTEKGDLKEGSLESISEFGFGVTKFKRFEFETAQMGNTNKDF